MRCGPSRPVADASSAHSVKMPQKSIGGYAEPTARAFFQYLSRGYPAYLHPACPAVAFAGHSADRDKGDRIGAQFGAHLDQIR